jgi:hypothetical protein
MRSNSASFLPPGAGHFDLVTPGTRAWEEVRARITAALGAAR